MHVAVYMGIFFFAMIGHELALEAATTTFSDLQSLAYAVTLFQFGFCLILPLVVSRGNALARFPRTQRELFPYVRLTIVVFGATALATQAVVYVAYPVKVVFKSAKLIPTMAVATLLQGKRYGALDYVAAALLCAGAAGYSYGSGGGGSDSTQFIGLALLLISILCDALVPNFQQILMAPPTTEKTKVLPHVEGEGETTMAKGGVSAAELMANVNLIGFACLLTYMAISGHLSDVVTTSVLHPRLVMYLCMVGVGLSTAVFAYTRLIQASGSVVAVAVATLRKVATVILSYVVFPKALLGIHVVSGFLVLGGIVLSSVSKQRSSTNR